MRRRPEPAVIWAGAGAVAGALSLVSPWLGLAASAGCLATAWWRRRPEPVPTMPSPGDVSTPWADPGLEALRLDLVPLWERVQSGSLSLQQATGLVDGLTDDWARRLGAAGANAQTLAREIAAIRGEIDTAVRLLTKTVPILQAWAALPATVDARMKEAAAVCEAQGVVVRDYQQTVLKMITGMRELHGVVVRLGPLLQAAPPLGDLLAAMRSMPARLDKIGDEAGRLGKPGWGVALAATEAKRALEPHLQPLEDAMGAWRAVAYAVSDAVEAAEKLPQPNLPPVGTVGSFHVEPLVTPPVPDLGPLVERLDQATHQSEMGAGAAEALASQLVGLQDETERLQGALSAVTQYASEMLILSGYLRVDADTPVCHLNKTAWCITDGDCERCPLTRMDEGTIASLLGAGGRRAQAVVRNTGRTIDLSAED
jgi:hypothetical protein